MPEGPRGATARAGLTDSFDDKEGYYTFTVRVVFAADPSMPMRRHRAPGAQSALQEGS
jgi:hypothetical protein